MGYRVVPGLLHSGNVVSDQYRDALEELGQKLDVAEARVAELEGLLERYNPNGIFRLWEKQPQFTLCSDSGLEARNGVCVAHGGDACLHQYVQVSALVRAFEKAVAGG